MNIPNQIEAVCAECGGRLIISPDLARVGHIVFIRVFPCVCINPLKSGPAFEQSKEFKK